MEKQKRKEKETNKQRMKKYKNIKKERNKQTSEKIGKNI